MLYETLGGIVCMVTRHCNIAVQFSMVDRWFILVARIMMLRGADSLTPGVERKLSGVGALNELAAAPPYACPLASLVWPWDRFARILRSLPGEASTT